MLQKRPKDLKAIRDTLHKSHIRSSKEFEKIYRESIRNFDLQPGNLVLVRNSKLDSSIGYKNKPRYVGLMVVVQRTQQGSYILAELDGSVSKLRFTAYQIIPYYPHLNKRIQITKITELSAEELLKYTINRDGKLDC
ncbi:hypothetical protein FA15DRAFT_599049 [Coprinopsis marcescibilis]|uniref:Uncharacterized protein n=1 Tax=Coprinopsis marcescibilis TaxID=230819 RepID=A0A5C3KKG4_COPMA|nr:hypothetical protein FA15DRAFT_599049 [Coprinopsis marcescibilis]